MRFQTNGLQQCTLCLCSLYWLVCCYHNEIPELATLKRNKVYLVHSSEGSKSKTGHKWGNNFDSGRRLQEEGV